MSDSQRKEYKEGNPIQLIANDPKTIEQFWTCILPNRCKGCELCETRQRIVPSKGTGKNGIVIVGQNPGRDEDISGVPFIGRAGKLLDELLDKAGIVPNDCWFTNACKCHSYKNQTPSRDQLKACQILLKKELEIVTPSCIVALGIPAVRSVLNDFRDNLAMWRVNGNIYSSPFTKSNVIASYHTAWALRSNGEQAVEGRRTILKNLKLARGIAKTEEISNAK